MFKTFLTAAAFSLVSVPAMASDNKFAGTYVEATTGYDDVTGSADVTNATYGGAVGVNVPVGRLIVGAEATVDNVFDRRDLGVSGRVGYTFDNIMPYVKVGFANYSDYKSRKLDGVRVGAGVEFNVLPNIYVKTEYRYTNYEKGVGKHNVLGGLGIRF